ncbi:MAG TPA: hypothetical protein VN493_14270 [Thermoanaerobaculia bacterium]|nr:hypothetical protein [Thermoanaerobaculia bacterium]
MADKGKIWELLGRSVRWEEVVRHAPKIVEAARVLYETNRQRQQRSPDSTGSSAGSSPGSSAGPDSTAGLKTRLADLEFQIGRLQENETRQAALVTDMAKQLEALTQSVDALAARMQLLLWLGGGALVVGLVALVLSLIR